ncbi:MAG: hypothetical protein HeimC3_06190 [Candidatus Heimdallarchaeota archaeon LC_3]|nr:MAG: hypothetical protein HeimC3_06190 [Candidatus Heimdallarchaeota archaeon LC_3]
MSDLPINIKNEYSNYKIIESDNDLERSNLVENNIFVQIEEISESIQKITTRRNEFTRIIRLVKTTCIPSSVILNKCFFPKQYIFSNIPKSQLHGLSIAGVDGGMIKQSFAGVNIIGYRAIGVVFKFGRQNISRCYYYPNRNPEILLKKYLNPVSNLEWDQIASYLRANQELKIAYNLVKKTNLKIDFLLMDGSFRDDPNLGVNLYNKTLIKLKNQYNNLLRKLFDKINEKSVVIAWIVKDSNLRNFTSVISSIIPHLSDNIHELLSIEVEKILLSLNDQILMNYLLSPGQRSFIITKDLHSRTNQSNQQYNSYSFFLKVVPFDIPLRIDFNIHNSDLNDYERVKLLVNKISSIVFLLSNISSEYSFPSPLIEADARARISQENFSSITELIQNKLPGNFEIKGLKRSRSPFKFNL